MRSVGATAGRPYARFNEFEDNLIFFDAPI
jgi:hypothetical protein